MNFTTISTRRRADTSWFVEVPAVVVGRSLAWHAASPTIANDLNRGGLKTRKRLVRLLKSGDIFPWKIASPMTGGADTGASSRKKDEGVD
jgi:hypothetical protein